MNRADPSQFLQSTTAPSRGALTTDFLTGSMSPLEYAQVRSCVCVCVCVWDGVGWSVGVHCSGHPPTQHPTRATHARPGTPPRATPPPPPTHKHTHTHAHTHAHTHTHTHTPQSLQLAAYHGFNLVVGDLRSSQVAYVSNRDTQRPRALAPGHYGVCSCCVARARACVCVCVCTSAAACMTG
jgi:hypothetical protein